MPHDFWIFATWLTVFLVNILFAVAQAGPEDHVLDDGFTFVTRPDIEAPRWDVKVYDESLVTPGYWFVEPYDYLDQSIVNGGKWTAPMIFDGKGELIWSGAYLSQQYNSFDFRVNKVLGEDMLTFLYVRNKTAVFMDTHFVIQKTLQTSIGDELENMHELQFVDDGTHVLYFYDETKNVSKAQSEAIGFTDWNCPIRENSVREVDLRNDELVFNWSSSEHIDLTESTFTERSVEDRCTNMAKGWDFIHANSLDKFPDGTGYLMSGRYTDAIYKIAPKGDIVWHLGGFKNDFNADFKFAKQHDAKILQHNSTHTVISFLDNARSENNEEAAALHSRGLIVSLHTSATPMSATVLREYPHPDGEGAYLNGRGGMQVLQNGHVFSCWVNGCHLAEYSEEGNLVMEARVKQTWLKSYRSYKFMFAGLPNDPPDVYAESLTNNGQVTTHIWTSWNGATEVASWMFYKSDPRGTHWEFLASSPRKRFETDFTYSGYAKYVFVEALDSSGASLGRSNVVETEVKSFLPNDAVAKEEQWLELQKSTFEAWSGKIRALASASPLMYSFLIFNVVVIALFGRAAWRGRHRGLRWWKGST